MRPVNQYIDKEITFNKTNNMKFKKQSIGSYWLFIIVIAISCYACKKDSVNKENDPLEFDISGLTKHYILSSATGNNDGTDWANAWTELPDDLERDHVYFIGDGNYSSYTFDDSETETQYIYVIKAEENEHGTEEGWETEFGDNQALFLVEEGSTAEHGSVITIQTGYWYVDGQIGSKDSGHGFKFQTTQYGLNYIVQILDPEYSNTVLSNIHLIHCELQHTGTDNALGGGRGFQVHSLAALTKSTIRYCYIHDIPGINIYFANSSYNVLEYSYISRNHSDPVSHGEGLQANEATHNIIVRYNTWEDIEGTAVIIATRDFEIYGNIAFYSDNYPNPGQGGGVSGFVYGGGGSGVSNTNIKIYNNTIYNMSGTNDGIGLPNEVEANIAYNNIWVDCTRIRFFGVDHDYNFYYNIDDHGGNLDSQESFKIFEPNGQMGTSDPFINAAAGNFHLSAETNAGFILQSPYNKDMEGKTRGADGIWSIGAFEFE
ncbi:MAG: DUF5123 domain-containing protein [bacterium]|nr:DUF5123 domain-containing protein [bacterium]